ncbi:MAG: hypothetical protein Q8922_11220 [Bacteroidota bacterium]|nr:hypothetical protein [Bacteroidota bacterium]MDP4233966.1 hypothetical protein [Bacteroidota bacterium]MDP4242783.1 hypothetical protein [Bacteroidota bacterium]MDP4288497.1 hypothetical protein [Bacteroidota bacterium]
MTQETPQIEPTENELVSEILSSAEASTMSEMDASSAADSEIPVSDVVEIAPIERESRSRERRERKPAPRRGRKSGSAIFERFVVIRWSGRREPVDDMYWAEATKDGDWIVVTELAQVRSRKEILTRLLELPPALIAIDVPLSYPADFFEVLKTEGISDWRALIKHVREDLKKNADDGIRRWIERIGAYRESQLEDEGPWRDRQSNFRDRRPQFLREAPPPYERRSLAERFRRTDHALRRVADRHLISPVQIGYNRLTKRYEFTDPQSQGRAALLGMSMLDQVLDTRDDVAVWPMMTPKPVTIVELLPWIFTEGERLQPEKLRARMATLEDRGWDIPSQAVDQAARNTDAQIALRCLLGVIMTEGREERQRRPIRDYQPGFYDDPQIKLEGWFYSVGYRSQNERTQDAPNKENGSEPRNASEGSPRESRTASQSAPQVEPAHSAEPKLEPEVAVQAAIAEEQPV